MTETLDDRLFRAALRIRLVEERIARLYPSDAIQSPVHLSIGQEAVAVGACAPLRATDLVFGTYRGHAFYLAKGGDLRQFMAELFGKVTGCARGKAGSMHLCAPEVGFMGASAVVGSTVPHAVGAALAARRLRRDQLVMTVFGDGATEQGAYHEALNFAALHRLPVLFLCENNGLAVHSRTTARQAYTPAGHARAYGVPAQTVDAGWDWMEIARVVGDVAARLRAGGGPELVEVRTMRYLEHVGVGEDFAAGYRTREEVAAWQARDPLCTDAARVARFTPALEREIDDAVAYAAQSPWPGPEEMLAHVG
jgi:pyruvate dehydrogenase E1 component alpha subunit